MTVSDNSQISANTESASEGGVITVAAKGNVTLNDAGNILANTDGAGNSGAVSMQANSLNIGSGESGISTLSASAGNAGTIDVTATNAINMSEDAIIVADTLGGKAGNINVQALQLNMTGSSLISANTVSGSNSGGIITVHTDSLSIQGETPLVLAFNKFLVGSTGITAESVDQGNAGSIFVTTRNLSLSQGAVISTASLSGADGGPHLRHLRSRPAFRERNQLGLLYEGRFRAGHGHRFLLAFGQQQHQYLGRRERRATSPCVSASSSFCSIATLRPTPVSSPCPTRPITAEAISSSTRISSSWTTA